MFGGDDIVSSLGGICCSSVVLCAPVLVSILRGDVFAVCVFEEEVRFLDFVRVSEEKVHFLSGEAALPSIEHLCFRLRPDITVSPVGVKFCQA